MGDVHKGEEYFVFSLCVYVNLIPYFKPDEIIGYNYREITILNLFVHCYIFRKGPALYVHGATGCGRVLWLF